jgi:hypothetical protein
MIDSDSESPTFPRLFTDFTGSNNSSSLSSSSSSSSSPVLPGVTRVMCNNYSHVDVTDGTRMIPDIITPLINCPWPLVVGSGDIHDRYIQGGSCALPW